MSIHHTIPGQNGFSRINCDFCIYFFVCVSVSHIFSPPRLGLTSMMMMLVLFFFCWFILVPVPTHSADFFLLIHFIWLPCFCCCCPPFTIYSITCEIDKYPDVNDIDAPSCNNNRNRINIEDSSIWVGQLPFLFLANCFHIFHVCQSPFTLACVHLMVIALWEIGNLTHKKENWTQFEHIAIDRSQYTNRWMENFTITVNGRHITR